MRPLKVAAICGIAAMVVGVAVTVIGMIYTISKVARGEVEPTEALVTQAITLALIGGLVATLLRVAFYRGFIILGKQKKNLLLERMGSVMIALALIGALFTVITLIEGYTIPNIDKGLGFFEKIEQTYAATPAFGWIITTFGKDVVIPLMVVFMLGGAVVKGLLGYALLQQKDIRLAPVAGWLEIGGIITGLATFAAMILEIIFFFKEDAKLPDNSVS